MVNLGSVEFWDQLLESPEHVAVAVCTIDLVNLEQTLQHHPAIRAWVTAAHEGARIAEARCEWALTKARATALLAAKEEKDSNTGRAKGVAVLEAETDLDPDVQRCMGALLNQRQKRAALRAIVDSLDDRLQMLIQLSVKQRKEHDDYTGRAP